VNQEKFDVQEEKDSFGRSRGLKEITAKHQGNTRGVSSATFPLARDQVRIEQTYTVYLKPATWLVGSWVMKHLDDQRSTRAHLAHGHIEAEL
jgi:hypothetical protein